MALPQAVATLGVVLGGLLIFIVFILSYWTIDILARSAQLSNLMEGSATALSDGPHARMISRLCCRASERTGKWTFGELISSYLGKVGSETLRFFIIINNGGGSLG